jgi:DNA invertase Pin-like site-specific DNA recombinase
MDKRYYVYFYLRSRDRVVSSAGTPYYVGKGSGYRKTNKVGKIKVPEDRHNIVIVAEEYKNCGDLSEVSRRLGISRSTAYVRYNRYLKNLPNDSDRKKIDD